MSASKPRMQRPTIAMQMAAVPVRNVRLSIRHEEGAEVVTAEQIIPPWMRPLATLMRLRRSRSYRIEGLGLPVWQTIDGVATIGTLVDAFAQRHRLSFQEARILVLGYLQGLMGHGLLVIVGFHGVSTNEYAI